jgi:hypothetical protein
MQRRGFEKINGAYVSRDYVIDDLHADNVIIDGDGNLHFIDPVPSLNTPEEGFGGQRTYAAFTVTDSAGAGEKITGARFMPPRLCG